MECCALYSHCLAGMYYRLLNMESSPRHLYTGLDEAAMVQVQTGYKEEHARMNSGNGLDTEIAKEVHSATGEFEETNMNLLARLVAEVE